MTASAPPDVTIESATGDDVAVLTDLWVELAADQRRYGSHLRTEENRGPIRETMGRHAAADTAFLARRSGDPVGFVTFKMELGAYRQNSVRGIVHNIYVRESDRSEGIGSALLNVAEEALEELGARTVALEAMAENDAARSFYRRHGYAIHRIELEKPINGDSHSRSTE